MPSAKYNDVEAMGPIEIATYTSSMLHLWIDQALPTMNCAKAYALIKYGHIQNHLHYKVLMTAMLRLHKQQRFSKATPYETLSEGKRAFAIQSLNSALEQFPMADEDWLALIPVTDRWHIRILERWNQQIGFRRDPEGSIDLEAFARDSQSVHRSSVQKALLEGLQLIQTYPVPDSLDAFNEIMNEYTKRGLFRPKHAICYIFAIDMDTLSVSLQEQTYSYLDIVTHLWAHIRSHSCREELVKRLMEELEEGHLHCGNGKMARLVNVLSGFEDLVPCLVDSHELFQNKIVELLPLPTTERIMRAQLLFREFSIQEEEQGAWLEALETY